MSDENENIVKTSFGDLLKQARQNKSLSLEEVCSDLKINLKLLRNLEDSNVEELPQRAFTRGLIKSYAKYLKVEHEDILNLYDGNFESNSHFVKTGVLKKSDDRETVFISDVFQKTIIPVIILFLTVAGVLAVAIFLKSYNPASTFNQIADNSLKNETESTSLGEQEVTLETDQANSKDPIKGNETLVSEENSVKSNKDIVDKAKNQIHTLVVEPLDNTALTIKTNLDEKAVKAWLKPNKIRTFKFESAEIKYFDAGAVNLLLNGKNIGVPGNFGEQKVVRYPTKAVR